MAERGQNSPKAARIAALDTRRRKDNAASADRLRAQWRARAEEHGLGPDDVPGLLGRARTGLAERDLAASVRGLAGPDGITREHSTFDRRAAIRWWAEAHRHGARPERVRALADAWLASSEAVALPNPDRGIAAKPAVQQRYSTSDMLAVERRLIEVALGRRGEGVAVVASEYVDRALADRPTLAEEQAVMVRALTESGDGVEIVRAAAGTGKTFALDAARAAWDAAGLRVYGCALSARAAAELQAQTGIDATTIAQVRLDLERGHGLPRGGVLVVVEAGMVGSRQLAKLADHAAEHQTKLVLLGDNHQLPEIEAGGAFAGLANRVGAHELKEVRRQREPWDREALAALRTGDVDTWAESYREQGRVVARTSAGEVRKAFVTDWWRTTQRDGHKDSLMIAHSRDEVRDLNERARALVKADGRLSERELTAGERKFAEGDRIVTTHNDRGLGVTNGQRGTVSQLHDQQRALSIIFDGGREARIDAAYLEDGHLDHGYATTAHKAQGATLDRVFVLGSESLYREWGSTALSRHRETAKFYIVSPSSAERTLPGLQAEPDPLSHQLQLTLGTSRAKALAVGEADTGRANGSSSPATEVSKPKPKWPNDANRKRKTSSSE